MAGHRTLDPGIQVRILGGQCRCHRIPGRARGAPLPRDIGGHSWPRACRPSAPLPTVPQGTPHVGLGLDHRVDARHVAERTGLTRGPAPEGPRGHASPLQTCAWCRLELWEPGTSMGLEAVGHPGFFQFVLIERHALARTVDFTLPQVEWSLSAFDAIRQALEAAVEPTADPAALDYALGGARRWGALTLPASGGSSGARAVPRARAATRRPPSAAAAAGPTRGAAARRHRRCRRRATRAA
jgi:hypothetical protein